jgi:hypothetical protein
MIMSEEQFMYLRMSIILLSIGYGIWQHNQRRKIEKFIAHKAMELNRTIDIGLGAAQSAIRSIAAGTSASVDIGRAEGLLNAALVESADLYCNLKKTTLDEIEEMVANNQIVAQHQPIFNTFSNRRIGFIRKALKYIAKAY